MERSKGSKKSALKAVVLVVALAAAMATTGCAGSSLMGPESGTQGQGQVANPGAQHSNPGGQHSMP